jgi:NADH-quinone oxidoreductase subunit M
MVLAVIGILYGAILAFAQTDLKRLVAYTSVSHLGFVLLGIFAWNKLALQGALITIICHGVSTGALFILVGALQERLRTRELARMSGLWATVPRLGGAGLFFALASMGLPGLGDFVGEFMILLGVYQKSRTLAAVAAVGILASTFYALKFVQYAFHGPNNHHWAVHDLGMREAIIFIPMIVILLWLGLYPQPVFNTFNPAMETLQQHAGQTMHALRR